jgi:uncharacterized protein (TIGR00369 family)
VRYRREREMMRLDPNPANACFGCGGANARGMKLAFEQDFDTRRIRGLMCLGPEYQGGVGFIHGGIIATLLDEAMGKVARFRQVHAVTAELKIEYLKPVRVDQDLVIEAYEVEKSGRNLHFTGEIRDRDGMVLARGQGRFIALRESRAAEENAPDQPAGNQVS